MKTSKTLYCVVSPEDALNIKKGEFEKVGEGFDKENFPSTTLNLKDGEKYLLFFANVDDAEVITDQYVLEQKIRHNVYDPCSIVLRAEIPLNVWVRGQVGKTTYDDFTVPCCHDDYRTIKQLAINPTKLGNTKITGFVFNEDSYLSSEEIKNLFAQQDKSAERDANAEPEKE